MKISDIKPISITPNYVLSEKDKDWIINKRAESRTASIFYKSVNARFGIISDAYDFLKADDKCVLEIIQRKINERYIEICELRNQVNENYKNIVTEKEINNG